MELNIVGQYKNVVREQVKLRRMIEKNDQRLALLKKYMEHVKTVARSREEIKAGKLYTLEEVEKKLGLK